MLSPFTNAPATEAMLRVALYLPAHMELAVELRGTRDTLTNSINEPVTRARVEPVRPWLWSMRLAREYEKMQPVR